MDDGNNRTSNSETSGETLATVKPSPVGGCVPAPSPLAIEFDPAEFFHFLADADMSEAEMAEYITLVSQIICDFVALGFDVHPIQLAQESGGKHRKNSAEKPAAHTDMVNSSHGRLIEEFMRLEVPVER